MRTRTSALLIAFLCAVLSGCGGDGGNTDGSGGSGGTRTADDVAGALTNLGVAQMGLGELASARESLSLAHEYNRIYWPMLLSAGILEQRGFAYCLRTSTDCAASWIARYSFTAPLISHPA